jgi:hypothetical protein
VNIAKSSAPPFLYFVFAPGGGSILRCGAEAV